jgi:fatty-acyl-CoA synthase
MGGVIDAIYDYNITHFCAAPVILRMLMECPNINKLHKIKLTIITAGSSPSPKVISYFKNRSITLLHVYGLTETFGPHAICEMKYLSPRLINERLHTQGVASVHGMYMRVVNENMQDVPKDGQSLGEVIMRGNNVMAGYYKDLAATEQAFKGGWFHSEDLAVVHPNGYMEIMDRKKDIIISGGENISSIQIENILCSHEAVSLAAVLPKSDEQWGEVPIAVVELAFGKNVTEPELIQYCKTLLPGFMCPKNIFFKKLPLSSTGKVQKKLLKEQILVAGII